MSEHADTIPLNNQSQSRTKAPTALWSHLLSRSTRTNVGENTATPTPLVPVDKSGTSMRLLLYDTQSHLEKFSMRVDKLLENIETARGEVKEASRVCGQGVETAVSECVDLVNRYQTQLQKSIGEPSQAQVLSQVQTALSNLYTSFQATDRRFEALDTRFDVLHLLVQTQSKTIQDLQEQQTKILTTFSPLLQVIPLLQAIPLQIEASIRSMLQQVKSQQSHTPPSSVTKVSESDFPSNKKRNRLEFQPQVESSPLEQNRKRPRLGTSAFELLEQGLVILGKSGSSHTRNLLSSRPSISTERAISPVAHSDTPLRRPLADISFSSTSNRHSPQNKGRKSSVNLPKGGDDLTANNLFTTPISTASANHNNRISRSFTVNTQMLHSGSTPRSLVAMSHGQTTVSATPAAALSRFSSLKNQNTPPVYNTPMVQKNNRPFYHPPHPPRQNTLVSNKPVSLRDLRQPVRPEKRFIALDDDDDDEENAIE